VTRHRDETRAVDTIALASRLRGIVSGSWMSQATRVATELGLPDILAGGPKGSEELAAAAGAHAPSLRRLMRALSTIDICHERDDGSFELTEMGSLLRSDVDGSMRSWTIYCGAELWPAWGRLLEAVKTGMNDRRPETGETHFEHIERHPEAAALFNRAMGELTRLAARSIVEAYDFSGMTRIVDVGGGYGELLAPSSPPIPVPGECCSTCRTPSTPQLSTWAGGAYPNAASWSPAASSSRCPRELTRT
jgi:hypothetical protein